MKYLNMILLLCLAFGILSCEDEDRQRRAETERTIKRNDSILKVISSNWTFAIPPATEKVEAGINRWNEWKQFKSELAQKPAGGLNAYRQKTKNLVNKADQLRKNIPTMFNKPQVQSRLGVLITKIKSLYTYLNIAVIPDKKVTALIGEITSETIAVQNQMDEIIRLSEVPKEFGEEEMLRALDTTRMANPDRHRQPSTPSLQRSSPKFQATPPQNVSPQPGNNPKIVPLPVPKKKRLITNSATP
ncbi:hypothetical protein CHU92_09425 [Flavobacterium cyanobacteriorum]|uniref:Lipoprotein n=2 Tax=Flavobacterium cyanobacteriorum TaxID=2022802 RepID=A0A255Z5H6_9FLAO|nr:hypothetical protein CHU92_09425 [Flavobacterium cyanobacteriorum]